MAVRSGFFNSVNSDRKYDAGKFAEYFASFIGNGVFPNPATGLQAASNNDMTVTVQAGKAWINGYILINDDDYVLTLDAADGMLNRIDRIVARYDTADREIRLEVKKGTFASSPVAPALQRDADAYELGLADVYIAAGAVSISQANITDLRMNSSYCGIVKGTVDQIDTTNLFAQYQAAFEGWFQELQDVLDENTAANLLNRINQVSDAQETHEAEDATDAHLPENVGIGTKDINLKDKLLIRPEIKDYAETLGTTSATTGTVNLDLETGNTFVLAPTGACIIAYSIHLQVVKSVLLLFKLR